MTHSAPYGATRYDPFCSISVHVKTAHFRPLLQLGKRIFRTNLYCTVMEQHYKWNTGTILTPSLYVHLSENARGKPKYFYTKSCEPFFAQYRATFGPASAPAHRFGPSQDPAHDIHSNLHIDFRFGSAHSWPIYSPPVTHDRPARTPSHQ